VTLAVLRPSEVIYGRQYPRIAPPLPTSSRVTEFQRLSQSLGIELMPWQLVAAQYVTAEDEHGRSRYREIGIVVARQNGKSTLLIPMIVDALMHARRVMHTAQNRTLPREVFEQVAEIVERRGMVKGRIRYANGQEHFSATNGGMYRIVAPTRGGARGPSNDLVIIDELREMDDWSFIGAAKPTMTASSSPQLVYLSNAGTEESVVLNALRSRGNDDPNLAYLEWSAETERKQDDVEGWAQANPALGHMPAVMDTLESEYIANKLAGTLGIFETEHLCRWVDSLAPKFVPDGAWMQLHGQLEEPRRPFMAVSMDPSGTRASAVLAWRTSAGHVGVRAIADVTGTPIDADTIGDELKQVALKLGVSMIAFDPWTDTDLARRLPKAKALAGRDFAVACENFTRRVADGSIRWDGPDIIGTDLGWTTRKSHETGAYHAVKSSDEHTITSALAAIRAVWLATSEKPPNPKVL